MRPVELVHATDDLIRRQLQQCPEVADALIKANEIAWQTVDAVVLELCRIRIAQLLRCQVELAWRTPAAAGLDEETIASLPAWPTSDRFGLRERACLAFTEQFVMDVSSLDESLAIGVRDHLGDVGLVNFASALLVVEQRQRSQLAWMRLNP